MKKPSSNREIRYVSHNAEEEIPESGSTALAHAIVLQAVKDLRSARVKLKKSPDDIPAKRRLREIQTFFNSQWFYFLSGLEGEYVLKRLMEEPV